MNVEQAITHLRYRNVTNKERFTEAIDILENEINRQKAEIERLNIRKKALTAITKNYDWKFAKAKSETRKEFAEMIIREYPEADYFIRNLLKEMEGE